LVLLHPFERKHLARVLLYLGPMTPEAAERAIAEYRRQMLKFAYSLDLRADSEDVVQRACISVWPELLRHEPNDKNHTRRLLMQHVEWRALDHFRQRTRRVKTTPQAYDEDKTVAAMSTPSTTPAPDARLIWRDVAALLPCEWAGDVVAHFRDGVPKSELAERRRAPYLMAYCRAFDAHLEKLRPLLGGWRTDERDDRAEDRAQDRAPDRHRHAAPAGA
jgi:DNA-directed RNA polymerase specialized sigma24 family protein